MSKVKGNELAVLRQTHRSNIIGVLEGVFDIVHAGHLVALSALRRQCDFVVVMIQSDEHLRSRKVISTMRQSHRLAVVSNLRLVDFAYTYTGSLDKHLRELRPDVFGTAHLERYPKDFAEHLIEDFKCTFAQLTRVPRPRKRLIYEP